MKEIKRLINEIDENTPDLSERIENSVDWTALAASGKREEAKPVAFYKKRSFIAAFAACLLVVLLIPVAVMGFFNNSPNDAHAAEYDLVIDVNPRIMLTVDSRDEVIAQSGLNEDGIIFLYDKKYVGLSATEAAKKVIAEMERLGVVKDGGVIRLSTVYHNSKTIDEQKQSRLESAINSILNGNVTTVFLSDDELDKLEDYYKDHEIAEKEAEVIDGLKTKITELIGEKRAAINELLSLLENSVGGEEVVNISDEVKNKISEYCLKYGEDGEFLESDKITEDDIEDFIETLTDSKEDLAEALEELNEKTESSDYGEILKEFIEIVKEEVFNKED